VHGNGADVATAFGTREGFKGTSSRILKEKGEYLNTGMKIDYTITTPNWGDTIISTPGNNVDIQKCSELRNVFYR